MLFRKLARAAGKGSLDAEGRPPESSDVAACRNLWKGFSLADDSNFHKSSHMEVEQSVAIDAQGLLHEPVRPEAPALQTSEAPLASAKGVNLATAGSHMEVEQTVGIQTPLRPSTGSRAAGKSVNFAAAAGVFVDRGPGKQVFPGGKKLAVRKRVISKPARHGSGTRDEPSSLDLSVTVSVGGVDVWESIYTAVCGFLESECLGGVVSLERGSNLDHLHVQAVFRMAMTSPAAVNVRLKKSLGWDTHKPAGGVILCKALKDTKMHCYEGMIGYCLKDFGKVHHRHHMKNVTADQIERGKNLYALYGAGDIKNCVTLDNRNLFAKAKHFHMYHGRRHVSASLVQTICRMLKTEKFVFSGSWVLPTNTAFISQHRVEAAWRITLDPAHACHSDVRNVLFGLPPGIVPIERIGKGRRRYWDAHANVHLGEGNDCDMDSDEELDDGDS